MRQDTMTAIKLLRERKAAFVLCKGETVVSSNEDGIAIGQRLLNAFLHLLGSLFQLHGTQSFHHGLSFSPGSFLALLSVYRLEQFGYQLHLGARRD